MSDFTFIHFGEKSEFAQTVLGESGLAAHDTELRDEFMTHLIGRYGEEHLDEPGLTYHNITVFNRRKYDYVLYSIKKDKNVSRWWSTRVRVATVTLIHSGSGTLECDWKIELNIASDERPLFVGLCFDDLSGSKFKDCFVFTLENENYDRPDWTAFLLRYQ